MRLSARQFDMLCRRLSWSGPVTAALRLVCVDNRTQKDAAAIHGVTQGAISMRLRRMKQYVADEMESCPLCGQRLAR